MSGVEIEQSLVLIKPDAIKNSLSGFVLSQLSEYHTGLMISASKIVHVGALLAGEHYYEHKTKSFFPSLLEYISGEHHFPQNPEKRRVEAFIFQGPGAIQKIRDIAGPTNPHVARDTKAGALRSLGTVIPIVDENGKKTGDIIDNLIHASANPGDAEREIKLWFKPLDIPVKLRKFDVATSESQFYYKDGKLSESYSKGSFSLVSPGDLVWKSDLDALQAISKGQTPATTLESVAAKYLFNIE